MAKVVKLYVRPTPRSERFPSGVPEAFVEVEIGSREFALFRELTKRAAEAAEGSQERREALNEIHVLSELVGLLDARVVPPAQQEEMLPPVDYGARQETLATMAGMEERGFSFPESVKAQMASAAPGDPDPVLHKTEPVLSNNSPNNSPNDGAALGDPDAPTLGKFHRDAHPTEQKAAVMVYPRTGTQGRRVLNVIGAAGERGATDEEIGEAPGVADTAHRTRRNHLVSIGWVVNSGRTRKTESGADSIVWVLSVEGRAKWRPEEAMECLK